MTQTYTHIDMALVLYQTTELSQIDLRQWSRESLFEAAEAGQFIFEVFCWCKWKNAKTGQLLHSTFKDVRIQKVN